MCKLLSIPLAFKHSLVAGELGKDILFLHGNMEVAQIQRFAQGITETRRNGTIKVVIEIEISKSNSS